MRITMDAKLAPPEWNDELRIQHVGDGIAKLLRFAPPQAKAGEEQLPVDKEKVEGAPIGTTLAQ